MWGRTWNILRGEGPSRVEASAGESLDLGLKWVSFTLLSARAT
jgi:hypothetical protein